MGDVAKELGFLKPRGGEHPETAEARTKEGEITVVSVSLGSISGKPCPQAAMEWLVEHGDPRNEEDGQSQD